MKKIKSKKELNEMYEKFMIMILQPNKKLNDIYKNYSSAKINAFDNCKKLYKENKTSESISGIITFNKNQFTYGFTGKIENENEEVFVYITKAHIKYCLTSDMFRCILNQ